MSGTTADAVVVVGAGMGAMAAAARLATAGRRVTVLERGATHGGALGRLSRGGFSFDTGPGLLHLPAVWRDLFLKTAPRGRGRPPGELADCLELRKVLDPAVEHRFADGRVLRLPGLSPGGVRRALDETVGAGAGERWGALLGRARETWEASRRPLFEEPLTSAEQRGALRAERYPARRRGLLRRRAPSLTELAADELGDQALAAVLTGTVQEYGLDPRSAPADAAVLAYVEQTFGSWYPVGGMRVLADALHTRCRERGVTFRFGAEVAEVLRADGRAAGVRLADGETVAADAVVWGAPRAGERAGACGRFTLFLALDGARPAGVAHRTLLHRGGPVTLVYRPDDATLRPAGRETAVLSALVPAHGADGLDWSDEALVARWRERLLAAAEAAGLGLRERVLWSVTHTPLDLAAATGAAGGAVPAPALGGADGAFLAAANTGRLAGAYRVGAAAHPGGGLAQVGMSGALAAGLIVEGPGWRGSY
ncbi:NAD(P)/FAD-dependent oxidoreductase [Streptomyces sp. DSM 44915]|uniref:NAD(P)/FAD-dependent oxidoreductase n=1 Tax=Streptomyces chisholmiae TaxID=3075540 RepID=A0ABU2JIZ1_9ACTN|nr:NAD(P)/FAD-dependent oxidoreductase [Streptomyces sp. DSM 44915]MDT0264962.1 NAD(P)/FAD-dependent oxidoreductase [Streptomyces sp. DSM 44915]